MGLHVPVDLRPEIEEAVARGGVISRRDLIAKLGRLEERPEWSEATYLTVYHTEVSYTIETPKPFPIKARVNAHIAAVETLMNALKREDRSALPFKGLAMRIPRHCLAPPSPFQNLGATLLCAHERIGLTERLA